MKTEDESLKNQQEFQLNYLKKEPQFCTIDLVGDENYCLDIENSFLRPGTNNVILWRKQKQATSYAPSQYWRFKICQELKDGWKTQYTIHNRKNENYVLTEQDGTLIISKLDPAKKEQQLFHAIKPKINEGIKKTFVEELETGIDGTSHSFIKNSDQNLLEVLMENSINNLPRSGLKISFRPSHSGPSQKWVMNPIKNGYYSIDLFPNALDTFKKSSGGMAVKDEESATGENMTLAQRKAAFERNMDKTLTRSACSKEDIERKKRERKKAIQPTVTTFCYKFCIELRC